MNYEILTGDNRETLKTIPDSSIDAIVTDPPYGIDFLGKAWDANVGALETYQECLRVLKPGGHILAFSAARTYHYLAVTLEQAGFEIRDQIMWIYSSGFPKSQDVGRQIQKAIYGKPDKQRFDPAIMIRVKGDQYRHPDNNKIYRKLPDINGDRLKKSHEGEGYGCVFEEVLDIKYDKIIDTTKNAGFGQTDHARVRAGEEWSTIAKEVGQVKIIDPAAQQWAGWGTQLKPAHEPICLARKPMKTSIARNCQEWGVGALNIDATRVPWGEDDDPEAYVAWMQRYPASTGSSAIFNNILSEAAGKTRIKDVDARVVADRDLLCRMAGRFPSNVIGEIPDYQKYFYCPKVSRRERHTGFDDDTTMNKQQWLDLVGGKWCNEDGSMGEASKDGAKMCWIPGKGKIFVHGLRHEVEEMLKSQGREAEIPTIKGNNHPTVKPVELMKYLIRLITPPGGTVLDPFTGSGSTGMAAVELGHVFIGCELDPAYVDIAKRRIEAWYQDTRSGTTFEALFE